MTVIRSFIAIELPREIQRRLDQVIKQLQQSLPGNIVRWVPAENIHLTLKFLGDVSLANVEVLKKILQAEAHSCSCFEISIGDLGAFPSTRRPRVIWIGIQAPPELAQIQHGIEVESARLGYAPEERPFSPHLTLGRVSRSATPRDVTLISEALNAAKVGFLGLARVQAVRLYRSDLQPSGSIYTSLFAAPLAPAGKQVEWQIKAFPANPEEPKSTNETKRKVRWILDTLELDRTIVNALEDKKGEDIVLLDIHEISDFSDYFVVCSGTSDRMLQALADAVIEQVRNQYHVHGRIEGQPEDGWLLADFGDVILHLFSPDRRNFYRLEELWSRGKVLLRLQ